MRQLDHHIVLEPQLTLFQTNILLAMAKKAQGAMAAEARSDPMNAASAVASQMEYDDIVKALESEKKLYDKLFPDKPRRP